MADRAAFESKLTSIDLKPASVTDRPDHGCERCAAQLSVAATSDRIHTGTDLQHPSQVGLPGIPPSSRDPHAWQHHREVGGDRA